MISETTTTIIESGRRGLLDVVDLLVRRWYLLLLGLVGGGALGLLVALIQPPVYEATCTLLFPKEAASGLAAGLGISVKSAGPTSDVNLSSLNLSKEVPNSDYAAAILRSRTLAEDVANSLKLEQKLGLSSRGEAVAHLRENFHTIKGFRDYTMDIRYRCGNAKVSAEVIHEYLQAYKRFTDNHDTTQARRKRVFVEDQLGKNLKELSEAEQRLIRFETSEGAKLLESRPESASAVYSGVRTRLFEAKMERDKAAAEVAELRSRLVEASVRFNDNSAFPVPVKDPATEELRLERLLAQAELDNLKISRTDEHPEVRAAQKRLDSIEAQLARSSEGLLTATQGGLTDELIQAEADLAAAEARYAAAEQQMLAEDARLRELPEPGMEHRRMERQFGLQEKLVELLQQELTRAQVSEALDSVDLQVLDKAEVPTAPLFPQPLLYAVLGAIGGLMVVVTWMLLSWFLRTPTASEA